MLDTQEKDEAECLMRARRRAVRAQTVPKRLVCQSVSQGFYSRWGQLAHLTIPPWQMLLLPAPKVDHLGVDTA